jgi:translation initiation factor IF-2
VLIQTGTLHQGDIVQIGEVAGKIRAMKDYTGKQISAAPPSTPVRILGLKAVPEVGDFLRVTDQKSLKSIMKNIKQQQTLYRHQQNSQSAKTKDGGEKNKKKSLNIIVKTDMVGSQEALLQSLETLSNEEIKVTVIKKGLGNIMDMDVLQAESSAAIIYGFNVKINQRAKEISSEKNVPVRTYNVIYDLINDVKKEVDKLISFKIEVIELGRAKIIAIFRTEKSSVIIGTLVTKGKIEKDAKTNIVRQDKKIGTGVIKELQQAKQAVASVASGTECGVQLNTSTPLQVGDFLDVYKEELKK